MDWHCIRKKSEKCIDHLLLHCEVVKRVVGFDFPSFQERVGNVPTGGGVSGSWIGQFDKWGRRFNFLEGGTQMLICQVHLFH
jgi:hypothetical protein